MRLLADWTTRGSKTSIKRFRRLWRISAPIRSLRTQKRARMGRPKGTQPPGTIGIIRRVQASERGSDTEETWVVLAMKGYPMQRRRRHQEQNRKCDGAQTGSMEVLDR